MYISKVSFLIAFVLIHRICTFHNAFVIIHTFPLPRNTISYLYNNCKWVIDQYEKTGAVAAGAAAFRHVQVMCAFENAKTPSAAIKVLRCANLQVVRDTQATYKYVTDSRKRDPDHPEIIIFGEIPPNTTSSSAASPTTTRADKIMIKEAVECGTFDDAMWLVEKRDPIYYIANKKRLALYFSSKFDAIEDRQDPTASHPSTVRRRTRADRLDRFGKNAVRAGTLPPAAPREGQGRLGPLRVETRRHRNGRLDSPDGQIRVLH